MTAVGLETFIAITAIAALAVGLDAASRYMGRNAASAPSDCG